MRCKARPPARSRTRAMRLSLRTRGPPPLHRVHRAGLRRVQLDPPARLLPRVGQRTLQRQHRTLPIRQRQAKRPPKAAFSRNHTLARASSPCPYSQDARTFASTMRVSSRARCPYPRGQDARATKCAPTASRFRRTLPSHSRDKQPSQIIPPLAAGQIHPESPPKDGARNQRPRLKETAIGNLKSEIPDSRSPIGKLQSGIANLKSHI